MCMMMVENSHHSDTNNTEQATLMTETADSSNQQQNVPRSYKDYRKTVYYFLERPETKIALIYHLVNLVLIVGSIITSILSTIKSYENDPILIDLILYYELSLLSWFTVEYLLRVWSCSYLGKYKGFFGRIRFMKTLYMMIDAFVIISTLTTAILSIKTAYFTILRVTRFLQIFRILRLDRQRGDLRTMGRVVYKHRKELVTCYFVGFIILFGGTYLIYVIEKSSAGDKATIDNMANGLYWAMITVTSVGYGDISPETWAGKLITGVFALVGCAFFALPAGILGSGFALQVAKQKKQKRYIKVRNPAAIVIQTCWRNYAVAANKYQTQATWYFFFPKMSGYTNTPEYYEILPGIQELLKSSYCPTQLVNKHAEETLKRKMWPRQNRKTSVAFMNGSTADRADEKSSKMKRKNSKSNSRKKNNSELPISSLLNKQYKEAIRFVLRVKLFTAIKIFKNVRYPFVNVQDIMEKNALCHTETLSYLKHIQDSLSEFRGELKDIRKIVDHQQQRMRGIPVSKTGHEDNNGDETTIFLTEVDVVSPQPEKVTSDQDRNPESTSVEKGLEKNEEQGEGEHENSLRDASY